ncbi:MAG: hypothetical protein A2287_04040 [Candidatus Melainabacteria bacterium RIFOXYA12_FULL_32_12]|nr:MAG: hypothetical protein A2287_04040 [Candidatus Melainabacteria bacterium RIFOXYA12_FULL_32_12]
MQLNLKQVLYFLIIFLVITGVLFTSQIGQKPQSLPAKPRYVATIHPLAAILKELTQDRAEVIELLKPGDSPHTYEPSPSDVRIAENSTALFYVSSTIDEWGVRLPSHSKIEVFSLVPENLKIKFFQQTNRNKDESNFDPHFWMDPITVKATLPTLVQTLSRLDPEGSSIYQTNAEQFSKKLDILHQQIKNMLDSVQKKPVVLFHPCCVYFLKRYNIPLLAVIEYSPGQEPSPRQIQSLIAQMKKAGTDVVFTEPQLPPQAAKLVAESLNAKVYQLDPLGGIKGRETYEELLLYNASIFREAFD